MQTAKFEQIDAVHAAWIVNRHKPEWDHAGILAAIMRVQHELDIVQALAAAMSAASDPEAKSPAALAWDRHRTKPAAPIQSAGKRPRCRDHPTEHASECRWCWSEVKAPPFRPPNMVGLHWEPTEQTPEAVTDVAASFVAEEAWT